MKAKFNFYLFIKCYVVFTTFLIVINLLWCAYFGNCFIDDIRHIHGEKIWQLN